MNFNSLPMNKAKVAEGINVNLPDFLIIGVIRGGTTSLFNYLITHSRIEGSMKNEPGCFNKEPHFFDMRYEKGIDWYKSWFPKREPDELLCEATPHYLVRQLVPARVYHWLPKAKFIALLRNPTVRAWSHYCHRKRSYHLTIENLKCLEDNLIRFGVYAGHLKEWFKYFPKKRFLILKSEDFFYDSRKIVDKCTEFLGVFNLRLKKYEIYDPLKKSGINYEIEYPKIPDDIKEYLDRFYRPHNQELYKLLGKDMEW